MGCGNQLFLVLDPLSVFSSLVDRRRSKHGCKPDSPDVVSTPESSRHLHNCKISLIRSTFREPETEFAARKEPDTLILLRRITEEMYKYIFCRIRFY